MIDVGLEQINPSILIVVGGVDSHAGARFAESVDSHTCQQADFFEPPFAAVGKQEIGNGVVGDVEIHPSVIVDVCRDDSPSFGQRLRNTRLLADIGKRAVAIIAEEPARHGIVNAGNAVETLARQSIAAELEFGFAVVDKVADEQIQPSVIVVIKPHRAGGPARCCDTGFCRHVGEGAVAVVVVKNAMRILRDVEVGEPVAVIVADGDAHAVRVSGHARFLRHVGESAVAVVVIERVPEWLSRLIEIAASAVHQINVHPAVVVVVEECAAGSDCLGQMSHWGATVHVNPRNAAGGGRDFFKRRRGLPGRPKS